MATGSEEKQDEHITFSSAWCFFCPPIKSLGKSAYRYIRVKILAGWGKILGDHAIWQNEAFFQEDL